MKETELKKIARIQFGILSPEEIRRMAVARIITADTYNEDGTPIDNGLMDRRLGTIEPGQRCRNSLGCNQANGNMRQPSWRLSWSFWNY